MTPTQLIAIVRAADGYRDILTNRCAAPNLGAIADAQRVIVNAVEAAGMSRTAGFAVCSVIEARHFQ